MTSRAEGRQFDPGQVYSMKQILRYDTRCSFALEIIRHRTQLIHHEQASCFHITDLASISQFARVVKGVDLRSTAGNCAWVRTPQLTFRGIAWFATLPTDTSEAGALQKQPRDLQLRLLKTSSQTAPRTRPPRQESGILLLKF